MTEEQESLLKRFETRLRQTLLLSEQLQRENAGLKEQLADKEETLRQTREALDAMTGKYELLLAGKSMAPDGDNEAARQRISKLVREINACIALIGE